MGFIGEFTAGKTIRHRFNSHKGDGTPITLAGSPAVSVYKGSTTESTAGVTLTVDYNARTGLHQVAIDTSADVSFYAEGSDFDLVITAGTVDSISVVGTVLATFSLSNRAGLRPTTADRTLAVSVAGQVDANVTQVDGTALSTHSSGLFPADARSIDGVAFSTHAAGMSPADLRDIAGVAVNTSLAQLGVNIVNVGGSPATVASTVDANITAVSGVTLAAHASGMIPADVRNVTDTAGIRAALGLAAANLDTQLSTMAGYLDTEVAAILAAVDTEVAAIKAKTDGLTFTAANVLDANIRRVNSVIVAGTGTAGDPWGP